MAATLQTVHGASNIYAAPLNVFSIRFVFFAAALAFTYQAYCYVYNLYFHPLRRYPGPKLWAASRIPHELAFCRGHIPRTLRQLHERYGDVVRISPTSLSFTNPDAWNDIYNRKPSQPQPLPRDPQRYTQDLWINGVPDIWTSPDEFHPRMRRATSLLFSDKALRGYEPSIMQHVQGLLERLERLRNEQGQQDNQIDLFQWLNCTMCDIIGDLAFGEAFGCLQTGQLHPWLTRIFESGRAVVVFGAIRQFPWAGKIMERVVRTLLEKTLKDHRQFAIDKVDRRLSVEKGRDDFMKIFLAHQGQPDGLTQPEFYPNANYLILAGSAAPATVMAGVLYHLGANPHALRDVTNEVRSHFTSRDDVSFEGLEKLPILTAAIDESMRMYPASLYNPRTVPAGGADIAGNFVPEGTSVCIYQSVAYHDENNFRDPDTYDPRRFLNEPKYDTDRKDAFRPFSVGPKNCVGARFVCLQMKMVLSSLILQYDLELRPESANWTNQEVFLLPKPGPLIFNLKSRA